jgi:hypothetical protein
MAEEAEEGAISALAEEEGSSPEVTEEEEDEASVAIR